MKRDKPWRPNDYPRPLLHIVEPEEPLRDPDLSTEQSDHLDQVLVIAFGLVLSALALVGLVYWVSHVQAVASGR